jgi:hypothetical protein
MSSDRQREIALQLAQIPARLGFARLYLGYAQQNTNAGASLGVFFWLLKLRDCALSK